MARKKSRLAPSAVPACRPPICDRARVQVALLTQVVPSQRLPPSVSLRESMCRPRRHRSAEAAADHVHRGAHIAADAAEAEAHAHHLLAAAAAGGDELEVRVGDADRALRSRAVAAAEAQGADVDVSPGGVARRPGVLAQTQAVEVADRRCPPPT
jgi:predicted dinucleotide-utilizing enzyme